MSEILRILFVEPFLGGSHQAFAAGWERHSRHEISIIGLPAYKWKWRMRHAPMTLAGQANELFSPGRPWHVVVCSDMLSVAEFKGLARKEVATLPLVCYFHENQLTYPIANDKMESRDLHFAFSNFVSSAAADENWFNSGFHLNAYFAAMEKSLKRMPDYQPMDDLTRRIANPSFSIREFIRERSTSVRPDRPFTILWPHRWEFDKNPSDFFSAMSCLEGRLDFRLIILGESFKQQPEDFAAAKLRFGDRIEHCGFVESQQEYWHWVSKADVAVSTAIHEFFGMAMLESAAAGVIPIVPNRLAYPEIFQIDRNSSGPLFYDGSINGLVNALCEVDARLSIPNGVEELQTHLDELTRDFDWPVCANSMDDRIEQLVWETGAR